MRPLLFPPVDRRHFHQEIEAANVGKHIDKNG
jgi:hypothetical protein